MMGAVRISPAKRRQGRGRPAKVSDGKPLDRLVMVRMSDDLKRRSEKRASDQEMDLSALVRKLLIAEVGPRRAATG
jgi:hypothetical protein